MTLGIVLDLVDGLLAFLAWCYFATQMLPMEHKGRFWLASGALCLAGNVLGYGYLFVLPDAQMPLAAATAAAMMLDTVLLPIIFWRASLLRRIVGVCVLNLCDGVAAGVRAALFDPIFGEPIPEFFLDELVLSGGNPLAWAVSELFYVLVLVSLMTLAVRLMRRGRMAPSAASGPLGLLLLSQLILCLFCFLVIARSVGTAWYVAMAALLALSVAVVVVGVLAADRCADRERARTQRLVQESRLAGYAANQEESQAIVRQIAVLRHDMRNEVAAALHMADRGDFDRAASVLRDMADRCERADAPNGQGGRS